VIPNTGGGLVGGDRLEIAVRAGEAARAQITTQATEKAYRSAGPEVSLTTLLTVGRDAWLEWLPHETILFDGVRLRRQTGIEVAPGGRALAGEIVVFGRQAHGEDLRTGLFRDDWSVPWWPARVQGRLSARGRSRRTPGGALRARRRTGDGDAPLHRRRRGKLDRAGAGAAGEEGRPLRGDQPSRSADRPLAGPDAAALRRSFGAFVARFRHAAAGLPARPPAGWST
jgi:urease accessory protein